MKEPLKYFLERTTPFGVLARFQREKKLEKKLRLWKKHSNCPPLPSLGKQRIIKECIKKFSPAVFIETGTYKGRMVYAVLPYLKKIYSIELDENLCRKAQRRFAGYKNVHIIQGQSGEVLPRILNNIHQPCLFWLDAHYSGGSTAKGETDTPVMQEIKCILNHTRAQEHVILIDDARIFTGENDYPALKTLENLILDIYPNWIFEVKDDIIRIHSKCS